MNEYLDADPICGLLCYGLIASLCLLALFPLFDSLSTRGHTSTLFPASDSTFRPSVSTSQFRPCLRQCFWLSDLTTYSFPFSWYCTQVASKGTPRLPPGSAFRRITRASSTTILVLSVSLCRGCISLRFSDLFWLPRFPVLQFDQGPYASLLRPTLRPLCFRYTSAYWFFTALHFD